MSRVRIAMVAFGASAVGALTVEVPRGLEPPPPRGARVSTLAKGKVGDSSGDSGDDSGVDSKDHPLLGTIVHTHTNEHLLLTSAEPTSERFSTFLADRVTDSSHAIDPRLLELLRSLTQAHPGARFEIVSGYRSEKLNESRRKKGRHVASHSQHSLGQAVDFRVVPRESTRGLDPRALEKEIRALGWDGGVGVYTLASDWFVHADVGKNRRWNG